MSTRTTERGMSSQASARLSLVDIVCLVSTFALLVAFVVLPWAIDAGTSVSGLSLLLSESPPLTPEVSIALSEIRWALLLVPIATVMAGFGLFLKLTGRMQRRWAIWLLPLAGLVGFAYFAMYFIHDGRTPLSLMQYTGVGFWIACFASGILFLQHFAAQSSASAYAAPAHVGLTQRMRRAAGKLVEGPRANQAVSSIFRFQSLFGLFIVIVLAIIISPTRDDSILFLNQRNLSNVARDVSETGILAVGMLLVIIIGGIDLSVGSVVALAATGGAYLMMRDLMPAYAAIAIILAMGLFIGWWNGWVSERFRVPSFVVTLGMASIARGLAVIWSNRIAVPLSYGEGGADPMFELIGYRIEGVFPVPAIIMVVVATIMFLVLRYSAFGRYLYAIGGNQTAARLSGVAVSRVKITAFMLCSLFAALAGLVHAAQLDQGSPNEAVGYELNAIAAVVIGGASLSGGRGTVPGAIAGALILSIINNMLSLNNVDSAAQLVIKGLLVVGAVALQQMRPRSVES
jgi:ribose transport system permease protein